GAGTFDEVLNKRPSRQALAQSCPTECRSRRTCPTGGGVRRGVRGGSGSAGAAQGGVIEMDVDLHPRFCNPFAIPSGPISPIAGLFGHLVVVGVVRVG